MKLKNILSLLLLLCVASATIGAKPFSGLQFPLICGNDTITVDEARRLVGEELMATEPGAVQLEEYLLRLSAARTAGYETLIDAAAPATFQRDMLVALITADSVDCLVTDTAMEQMFEQQRDSFGWDMPHAKCRLIVAADSSMLSAAMKIAESEPDLAAPELTKRFISKGVRRTLSLDMVAAKGANPYVDSLVFHIPGGEFDPDYPAAAVMNARIIEAPETFNDVADRVRGKLREQLYKAWIARLRQSAE